MSAISAEARCGVLSDERRERLRRDADERRLRVRRDVRPTRMPCALSHGLHASKRRGRHDHGRSGGTVGSVDVTCCVAAVTSDVDGTAAVTVETAVVTTWLTAGGSSTGAGAGAGGGDGAGGGEAGGVAGTGDGATDGPADCGGTRGGGDVGAGTGSTGAGVGAGAAGGPGADGAISAVTVGRRRRFASRARTVGAAAVRAGGCASAARRSNARFAITGVSASSRATPGTTSLSPGASRPSHSRETAPIAARERTPRSRWRWCRFVGAIASTGGVDAVSAVTATSEAGCSVGEARAERGQSAPAEPLR